MRRLQALPVLLLATVTPALAAPASPTPVGGAPVIATVVSVEGTVKVKQAGQDTWLPARVQMNEHASDRVKTEADSTAALEFVCGGMVGLNSSSEVELIAPRGAREVSEGTFLKLSSGQIWATLNTQKAPFKIVTPSATLGIRGTEFVVDENDGETELSVLSGAVEVTDSENVTSMVRPGEVLRARRGRRAWLRAEGLGPMRLRLQRRLRRLRRHLDGLPPRLRPVPPATLPSAPVRRRPPETP